MQYDIFVDKFSDLVTLLKNKLEEKWDAISLEQVKNWGRI